MVYFFKSNLNNSRSRLFCIEAVGQMGALWATIQLCLTPIGHAIICYCCIM